MPKLQLYINKACGGYQNLLNINPTTDVQRHVADLSDALRLLAYDPREKYEFYAISYLRKAVLFTVVRTLPDLSPNHLAATICIPVDAGIPADTLLGIIKTVAAKLKGAELTPADLADLRALLAADYPTVAGAPVIDPSHGADTAITFYGAEGQLGLAEIVRQGLFVPRLAAYARVLLIDSGIGMTALRNRIDPVEPQQLVEVLPPKATAEGFRAHVYGHAFTAPVLAVKGQPLAIAWERTGFDRIVSEFTPESEGAMPPAPDTSDARKDISPASFCITSHLTRQPVESCTISVNGTELTGPTSFSIADLRRAAVAIECPGYQSYSGIMDLASTTQALVQLRELRKVYCFELPVDTDEPSAPVKFDIHTTHPLRHSPVEGYRLSGELREGENYTNRLVPQTRPSIQIGSKVWIAVAVAALIVGIVIGRCMWHPSAPTPAAEPAEVYASAPTPADTLASTPASEAIPQAEDADTAAAAAAEATAAVAEAAPAAEVAPQAAEAGSLAELVKYLDAERIWTRQGLAQFPDAEGLFDDMNNYRFQRIKTYWGPLLRESHTFAKVAYAANRAIITKKNPNRKNHKGTYNRPGDDAIQWIGYIYWIDP